MLRASRFWSRETRQFHAASIAGRILCRAVCFGVVIRLHCRPARPGWQPVFRPMAPRLTSCTQSDTMRPMLPRFRRRHSPGKVAPAVLPPASDRSCASSIPQPLLIWPSGESHTIAQSRDIETTRTLIAANPDGVRLAARATKGGHLAAFSLPLTIDQARAFLRSLGLKAKTLR